MSLNEIKKNIFSNKVIFLSHLRSLEVGRSSTMLSKSRVFLSAPTASACCPACMSTDGLLHGHKTAATAPNFSSFVKARKGGGQHQQISHQNSKIFSRSPELTFQDVSLARTHHVTTTSCKTDWDSKHQPKGNMISQSA